MYHMSCVKCHLSHVKIKKKRGYFWDKVVELVGGGLGQSKSGDGFNLARTPSTVVIGYTNQENKEKMSRPPVMTQVDNYNGNNSGKKNNKVKFSV